MKTIAIWSTNEDKISGIKLWVESLKSWQIMENLNEYQIMIRKIIQKEFGWDINISSFKTESWVSAMPTTLDEIILWAKNRALNLIENNNVADFYVWTEWWTHEILDRIFLYSAVCIISSFWTFHYWTSNWIELSKRLAQEIKSWADLSDAFIKEHFSIPKWSISWALSMWEFTREYQFMTAFNSAMKPFCNSEYY